MKPVENQVINLLNQAIHGRKTHIDNNIEWEKIIEEGKAHKVEALLYSAINPKSIKKYRRRTTKELESNNI